MNPLLTDDFQDFRDFFLSLVDDSALILEDEIFNCSNLLCNDCCFGESDDVSCLEGIGEYSFENLVDVLRVYREELLV